MFLICVDTVHHFLIRGIKLAVLSLYCQQLIIQQSELSLSLFLDFPQDPKSKTICQSICCIKHRCIWLYGIYPWIPKIPKCIAMISQTLWGAESCICTLEDLGRSSCILLTATQVHRLCGGGRCWLGGIWSGWDECQSKKEAEDVLRYLYATFPPQLTSAGVMVDVKSTSLCWMGFSLNNMARVIIYGVNGAWYAQEGELTTFHTGLGSRHWPRHWQGLAWEQLLARLHLGAGRVLVQERQCTARKACSAQTRVRWSDLAWGRAVHPSRGNLDTLWNMNSFP